MCLHKANTALSRHCYHTNNNSCKTAVKKICLFSSCTIFPAIGQTAACSSPVRVQHRSYLVLFQSYLSLFLAANECPDTSVNLLILLHSLNKVSRKISSSVINSPLWKKHIDSRRLSTVAALIHVQYRKLDIFPFGKKTDINWPPHTFHQSSLESSRSVIISPGLWLEEEQYVRWLLIVMLYQLPQFPSNRKVVFPWLFCLSIHWR